MNKIGLTLIVPVYNEVSAIKNTIDNLEKLKSGMPVNLEIIIVNDGSVDGTSDILNTFKTRKDFYVLNHPLNRGYGAALKTGIKAAKHSYIAITDADDTYPNHRIPEFFDEVLKNDYAMLVGARTGENVNIPLIRKPPKWLINKLVNYMTNEKVPDVNSGMRIMKKDVVNKFLNILPDGFSFTTTITIAMFSERCPIKYIAIDYKKRKGKSKIRPIYDTLNFFRLIIRTTIFFDPLKVFLPISIILLATGFTLMVIQAILYRNVSTVSVIISLGGIQVLGIGILADLIVNKR